VCPNDVSKERERETQQQRRRDGTLDWKILSLDDDENAMIYGVV
jgi:hypothetical protein